MSSIAKFLNGVYAGQCNSIQDACRLLLNLYPLKAISVYMLADDNVSLHLVSQSGHDFTNYNTFILPITTTIGKSIDDNQILLFPSVGQCCFVNHALRNANHNCGLLVIPLPNTLSSVQRKCQGRPFGAIAIFAPMVSTLEKLRGDFELHWGIFAFLYSSDLSNQKHLLRDTVIREVAYSRDVGSVTYRVTKLLRLYFGFSAASLFIFDKQSRILRLRQSSRNVPDRAQYFLTEDSEDPTARAFFANEDLIVDAPPNQFDPKILVELESGRVQNSAILVIKAMPTNRGRGTFEPLAVMRGFNHRRTEHGHTLVGSITPASSDLLRYFSGMLSVIMHLILKNAEIVDDFERTVHGARSLLEATICNLEDLDADPATHYPPDKAYYVSDSVAQISELLNQLDRSDAVGARVFKIKKVELFGDIVSHIPDMLKKIQRVYKNSAGRFEMKHISQATYMSWPPVLADVSALRTVFRNLVENAIKYCNRRIHQHEIEIQVKEDGAFLVVNFSNNGIPIHQRSWNKLFTPGYRDPDAIARIPDGHGFGLADCREIMSKMNGSIEYMEKVSPTTFEIRIPTR